MTTWNTELHQAALAFRRALSNASEQDLEKAQQTFGTWASDSDYASACEPYSGVCVSIQAELKQRALNAKETEDADYLYDGPGGIQDREDFNSDG